MVARTQSSKHSSTARRPACNRKVERSTRSRQRGLAARGTFERRERAQELSSSVPVLVHQKTHENESEHNHLTTQPLQWLADETHHTPSGREQHRGSKCGVSITHCTVQAKGIAAHRSDRTRDDESLICVVHFECERHLAGNNAIARERLHKE